MGSNVTSVPYEHVSHTYQSKKSSGERPKVKQSPAGAGCAHSKSNLSQNAPFKQKQAFSQQSIGIYLLMLRALHQTLALGGHIMVALNVQ